MKTVAIYGVSPMVRLRLKLLAVIRNKKMSAVVSELIEQAFANDETELTEKARRRTKRVIRSWRP